jgi:hypothetical protein
MKPYHVILNYQIYNGFKLNQLFISFLNRFPTLNTRFNSLIESDLCLVSSFLDPRFGVKVFSADKREFAKARV